MTPVRKQRLAIAALVLVAAAVAAVLVTLALQENMTYLHSPSDVREGTAPAAAMFRLGGVVKEGSVQRQAGTLKVRFEVTDLLTDVPVEYEGMLPDLFREAQSVIARGRMQDGVFRAEEVLAKHDETYMPPEVAEKIAESHAKAAAAKASAASATVSEGDIVTEPHTDPAADDPTVGPATEPASDTGAPEGDGA